VRVPGAVHEHGAWRVQMTTSQGETGL
jgi:hypothetical protein